MILWHFLQYFPAFGNLPSCCVIVNTVGPYGIPFSGHSDVWVIHSVVQLVVAPAVNCFMEWHL